MILILSYLQSEFWFLKLCITLAAGVTLRQICPLSLAIPLWFNISLLVGVNLLQFLLAAVVAGVVSAITCHLVGGNQGDLMKDGLLSLATTAVPRTHRYVGRESL